MFKALPLVFVLFLSGCDVDFSAEPYPYPRHYMCFGEQWSDCYIVEARYVNDEKKCFGTLAYFMPHYNEILTKKKYEKYDLYKVETKGSDRIRYTECKELKR